MLPELRGTLQQDDALAEAARVGLEQGRLLPHNRLCYVFIVLFV